MDIYTMPSNLLLLGSTESLPIPQQNLIYHNFCFSGLIVSVSLTANISRFRIVIANSGFSSTLPQEQPASCKISMHVFFLIHALLFCGCGFIKSSSLFPQRHHALSKKSINSPPQKKPSYYGDLC